MARLDLYVQHLMKQKADKLELTSGQKVTFHFASGPRAAKQVIKHQEIVTILNEAAPPDVMGGLMGGQPGSFEYASPSGKVTVQAEPLNGQTMRLFVSPGGKAAAKPAAAPAAATPAAAAPAQAKEPEAAPEAKKEEIPKVEIESVQGEPKINHYLRIMYARGSSDLHLCTGMPPLARIGGEILQIEERPPFTHEELYEIMTEIMPEENKQQFDEVYDTDWAHEIVGLSRFRANAFMDRMGAGGVFRTIPFEILSVDKLGLPQKVLDLCWLSKGLVLVTGPTGSGKSTTLAALIDYINENRRDHILTIEDPVEFVHPNKKCLVNQREIGTHTMGFKPALRAALREDPDIILVGEMRDLETISIAIETAETGHLVFGTLHTTSAISTIDRIIDQFPADKQEQIRVMLSESFRGAIAQVLCKKIGGGRAAGYEILLSTPAVANLIREGKTFQIKSVMQTSKHLGMQTMNGHLLEHVREGRVTPEEAYIKCNEKMSFKDELKKMGIELNMEGADDGH